MHAVRIMSYLLEYLAEGFDTQHSLHFASLVSFLDIFIELSFTRCQLYYAC